MLCVGAALGVAKTMPIRDERQIFTALCMCFVQQNVVSLGSRAYFRHCRCVACMVHIEEHHCWVNNGWDRDVVAGSMSLGVVFGSVC